MTVNGVTVCCHKNILFTFLNDIFNETVCFVSSPDIYYISYFHRMLWWLFIHGYVWKWLYMVIQQITKWYFYIHYFPSFRCIYHVSHNLMKTGEQLRSHGYWPLTRKSVTLSLLSLFPFSINTIFEITFPSIFFDSCYHQHSYFLKHFAYNVSSVSVVISCQVPTS